MRDAERFGWLADIPLFAPLSDGDLKVLEAALVHQELQPEEVLLTQGAKLGRDEGLYILRGGHLSVSVSHPDGGLYEVARLAPGTVVGLVGLVDPSITHSATVKAEGVAKVAHLTRTAFQTIFQSHKPLAIAFQLVIARQLVGDLRKTDHALRAALSSEGGVRLDQSHTA